MSKSVTVLCPNGRREKVKVTPNTTVLQIIEETCLKRGFDPDKHDLKHGRNTLDVTSPFRFTGIPNNGNLEMVVRTEARQSYQSVTIALQLESNERRQLEISSDNFLSDMIKAFQRDGEDLCNVRINDSGVELHPVLVNMRDEIIGIEALEYHTLKSIGIAAGKTALRLVYRSIDRTVLDEVSQKIITEKKKVDKYIAKAAADEKVESMDTTISNNSAASESTISMAQTSSKEPEPDPVTETLHPPLTEESSVPMQTDPSTIPHSDTTDSSIIHQIAQQPAAQSTRPKIRTNYQQVENYTPINKPQPVTEFKFPTHTAGQSLYRNELADVNTKEYQPCDRQVIVFSPEIPESMDTQPAEDLPDEFFEVTKSDIQSMIADLRKISNKNEEQMLMTSSMRRAQLECAMAKYEFAIIRFHFPDKLVIQARFRPRETIFSLQKFVKEHLRDSNSKFTLYTTPPKTVLSDKAATLIEAHLVPMTRVYVGLEDVPSGGCLKQETQKLMTTRTAADVGASQSLPRPEITEAPRLPKQMKLGADGAATPLPKPSTSKSSSSGNLPKWYRPGK